MSVKNLLSQVFGAVGTAVNPQFAQAQTRTPNLFESTFLTGKTGVQPRIDERFGYVPGGSDIQTMEVRNQQGQFPLAGGYATMLEPLKGITDPDERRFLMNQIANERVVGMMDSVTRGREQRDAENTFNMIKTLREQQYADRLKSRPLEFQELVATNLLKTITDLPGQVMRAGRLYDKEALEALSYLGRKPETQPVIKYFT